jgi:hypothetical protein
MLYEAHSQSMPPKVHQLKYRPSSILSPLSNHGGMGQGEKENEEQIYEEPDFFKKKKKIEGC